MGGNEPSPIMSQNDPRRQTRNWFHAGSRRPDAVIVNNPSQPWSGDNIAAVVECKWGADTYGPGQREAYETIAGDREKLIEINDSNCQCPGNEREPVPVPVPAPERERLPDLRPVAVLAAVALVAIAVASAPVTATAAAAVVVVGLLGSAATDSQGSGGDADVI